MSILKLSVKTAVESPTCPNQLQLKVLVNLDFVLPAGMFARPPLHLALVLDRSASVAGDRLALIKRVATGLVRGLLPRDFVTIVGYAQDIELLVPHTALRDRSAVESRIQALDAGSAGCASNLSGGWLRAMAELHEHKLPGHLYRVYLLTGGQAHAGILAQPTLVTIAKKNRQRDIRTSIIAVDPQVDLRALRAIAGHGGGQFHIVKGPQAQALDLQADLGAYGALLAQNLELQLELQPPARIGKVLGALPIQALENGFQARLGDIRAGEARSIGFHLRLPTGSGLELAGALGRVTARCDPVVGEMLPERLSAPIPVAFDRAAPVADPKSGPRQEVLPASALETKIQGPELNLQQDAAVAPTPLQVAAGAAGVSGAESCSPSASLQEEVMQPRPAQDPDPHQHPEDAHGGGLGHASISSDKPRALRKRRWMRLVKGCLSPQRPEEAKALVSRVRRQMVRLGYEVSQIRRVQFALHELLRNAFAHGCLGRPEGTVRAKIRVGSEAVRMRVADDGPGFDFEAQLRREQREAVSPGQRGRGLLLLNSLCDRLDWKTDAGTQVDVVIGNRALVLPRPRPQAPLPAENRGTGRHRSAVEMSPSASRSGMILSVNGYLESPLMEQLQADLGELFQRGIFKLIVDLSDLEYISSEGAGVLIAALSEAQEHGGDIVLCNPSGTVREVLERLGVMQVLCVCDDLASAYAAISTPSSTATCAL